jgi:hypothetical protein
MTRVYMDCEAILTVPDQPAVAVNVELVWHRTDPVAVQVAVWAGDRPPTIWVFSRDLLAAGLFKPVCPTGGDVRIRPSRDDWARLELWLSSDSGRCVLQLDRVDVQMFVESTWRHLSPCAEGPIVHAEIDRLLAEMDTA